jgi:hypothetical protein
MTALNMVFMFPFLVLGPHRLEASSSNVKAETKTCLHLWHKGSLVELASQAVVAWLAQPVNTKTKKAKVALMQYNQFARVAGLADIKGIVNATQDTLDTLLALFKEPGVVEEATLRRLYGPTITPTRELLSVIITSDLVKKCLASVAPLTTPHKDGWRPEHMLALYGDQACKATITDLVGALANGDVTDATCDLPSSATRVVLLKKTEAEMEALKAKKGVTTHNRNGPWVWAARFQS